MLRCSKKNNIMLRKKIQQYNKFWNLQDNTKFKLKDRINLLDFFYWNQDVLHSINNVNIYVKKNVNIICIVTKANKKDKKLQQKKQIEDVFDVSTVEHESCFEISN